MNYLKHKNRWLVVFGFIVVSCNSAIQEENNSLELEGVYVYEFQTPTEPLYPYEMDVLGKSADSIDLKGLKEITNSEAEEFYSFLNEESSFNYNASICWEPHFGAYFLQNGKVDNYIEISLGCNRIMSAKKIPFLESTQIDGINLPRGLSSNFRNFIKDLMKKYEFRIEQKKNARYD